MLKTLKDFAVRNIFFAITFQFSIEFQLFMIEVQLYFSKIDIRFCTILLFFRWIFALYSKTTLQNILLFISSKIKIEQKIKRR